VVYLCNLKIDNKMDAQSLSEQVKHLAAAGSATLNIDERLKLQLALDELSLAVSFENIQLWGKINGKHSNSSLI